MYRKRSIIDHCRHIENVFEGCDHLTYYAVKANSNRELLRLISQEGLGADIGSKGELYLALESGFSAQRITFSGVGKREDEIAYAIDRDIGAFNVESKDEIELLDQVAKRAGRSARILLRLNLDIDAGGHGYISTSLRRNKFGVDWQQAVSVLKWAQTLRHIDVRGIHSHLGSQITKAEPFVTSARILVDLIKQLRREGVIIHELDFGGGFGVQYRGFVSHPQLPNEEPDVTNFAAILAKDILPLLKESGCCISIQPGRSIIAHAGVLLVKVLYHKETAEKVFVVVDGGMNDLIRPSLYNAYHQIVPLEISGAPHEKTDVVGPLCESGDWLALDRMLPRVDCGDYLAIMCAGAYGYVLSSNYNGRPRPAEVLIDGGKCTLIRERETIEEL
ncbi:MAG: diaminopimelate decarboxylase [Ignavibacteria bacterium]|nr:diaminopimelate decarboxylase [Ignavibacteria bacterium]